MQTSALRTLLLFLLLFTFRLFSISDFPLTNFCLSLVLQALSKSALERAAQAGLQELCGHDAAASVAVAHAGRSEWRARSNGKRQRRRSVGEAAKSEEEWREERQRASR